jgi:hypothetical protein
MNNSMFLRFGLSRLQKLLGKNFRQLSNNLG